MKREKNRKKRVLSCLLSMILLLCGCQLPKPLQFDGAAGFLEKHGLEDNEFLTEFLGVETPQPAAEETAVVVTPQPTEAPSGAAGAVTQLFEALWADDRDSIRQLCADELPGYAEPLPPDSRALRELYRAVYQNLEWRLGAVSEGNAAATAEVEVTAPDMRSAVENLRASLAAYRSSPDYAAHGESARQERYAALLEEAVAAVLDQPVTRKATLSLYRKDGNWAIHIGSEAAAALTGALTLALEGFDLPAAPAEDVVLEDAENERPNYLITSDFGSAVVTAIRPNDAEGYVLEVELQNYMRVDLVFSLRSAVINGYVLDPAWSAVVPAGGSTGSRIVWDRSAMAACGIGSVESITFIMDAFEKPAWPVYPIHSRACAIYPDGRYDEEPVPVSSETAFVLLDDSAARMTVLDIQSDGCWGCTLTVLLENRSGEELWYSVGDCTVNDRSLDPIWSQTLPAGTMAVETIRWSAGALLLADISRAESLDFNLYVSSLVGLDSEEEGISTGGHYTISVP